MKVLTSIATHGHPSCSVIDIPDDDAQSLIRMGFAVPAPRTAPEAAVVEAPENAAMPAAEPRKAPAKKAPAKK